MENDKLVTRARILDALRKVEPVNKKEEEFITALRNSISDLDFEFARELIIAAFTLCEVCSFFPDLDWILGMMATRHREYVVSKEDLDEFFRQMTKK